MSRKNGELRRNKAYDYHYRDNLEFERINLEEKAFDWFSKMT